MKIAAINSSSPIYNLAAHKIQVKFEQEGHEVFASARADLFAQKCQKAFLSAIFTWNLPQLCHDANLLKSQGLEVEVGGPAVTAMPEFVFQQTGITPHEGLDDRFEHVPGDSYLMTFTSRGCPRGCEFCIVQKVEGRKMILYDAFPIPAGENPWVGDNNILATSWPHQELVVSKLKHLRSLDFNSGFDCRIFCKDPQKYYDLYSQCHLERWRFAYDQPDEREPVKICTEFLHSKGIRYSEITVFCLVGFIDQTFEECREKLQYLIDLGTTPYPQRYRPLNLLSRNFTPPGWDEGQLNLLFQHFGVANVWRSCTWEEFLESCKKGGFKPKDNDGIFLEFAGMKEG